MIRYSMGSGAPSAGKAAELLNDLDVYELALDMRMMPHELRCLRKNNPRDYWHLFRVNQARKLGAQQIAIKNKAEAVLPIVL